MPLARFFALDFVAPTAPASKHKLYSLALIASVLCFALIYISGCTPSSATSSAASPTPTSQPLTVADLRNSNTTALSPTEAALPVSLSIPEIDLDVSIQPMGWIVVEKEGERLSEWDLPEGVAGWHLNSELAGTGGNVVVSGQQAGEGAVFAPLALGEVTVGQEIFLTDADGRTFIYQVSEVSDPIPVAGATAAEEARAAAYLEKTDRAILTLVTGWPEYTTTHRIFVVAEFVGMEE